MNESLVLATHIAKTQFEDIPVKAVEAAKKSFLDALAVTLAASTLGEGCKQFVDFAIAMGGEKESTIIGFNIKVPAAMAAFANGSMAHALDFEDAYDGAPIHPNAATIPAALAVAESIGKVSGEEFLTALILGSDLVCRLGLALNENPLERGWYIPPILSSFGATAAASKLLNLSSGQILDAFSLTLCQATCSGEIIHSPHSIIRSIRDAFSAKAGVLSAILAQGGVTGFNQPLEGKAGLLNLYSRDNYDETAVTKGLGKTYENANVSFKPWPSCRGTHPYIDAVLQILFQQELNLTEIEEIQVVVNSVNKMLCEPIAAKQAPVTAIDAKFSLPFVIGTALLFREVTLEHFTPQAIVNKDVLAIARKVTYQVDAELTLKEATQGYLKIRTKKETLSKRVAYAYGHPTNPIGQDGLIAKFMDCAKYSATNISPQKLKSIVELILNLEKVDDIRKITEAM